jgi:hypothetical protein
MFHADIGRFLGLRIETGKKEITQGIGGLSDTWIHDIALYVPGGPVTIKAAFKEKLPVAGLLGMNGFFEHFLTTFDQTMLTCEIDRVYSA